MGLRRTVVAAAGVLALTGGPVLGGPALAAPGEDHRVAVSQTVSLTGSGPTGTLTAEVPAGTQPRSLAAQVTNGGTDGVHVTARVAGEIRAQVDVAGGDAGQLDVPLTAADVGDDGQVSVDLAATGTAATTACVDDGTDISVGRAVLTYAGQEQAPTSVDTFFPARATRVTVVTDTGDADLLDAALSAVAALAVRYDADTDVTLADAAPAADGPWDRSVRLVSGSGEVATSITDADGLPTLVLRGAPGKLVDAARALAGDATSLANAADTTGLAATPAGTSTEPTSLSDLGTDRISLTGYAGPSAYVGVRQSDFGGPLDGLDIDLVGTHTALPEGAQATLDVYWNDALVASQDLTTSSKVDVPVHLDADQLQGANGLRVVASAVPVGHRCGPGLTVPFEVAIDGHASTVDASHGSGSLVGFARFPQALGGTLPVAVRDPAADATLAGSLVAALQRESRTLLAVDVVDADDLIDGSESGLLVGATFADSNAVKAPLRLDGMRLLYTAAQQAQVGTDEPYAALQAVHQHHRDLLLLGGWAPAGASSAGLARTAVDAVTDSGWAGLSDDLLLANGNLAPFTISSATVYPQQVTTDERRSLVWWLVGGVAVILLLALARFVVVRRRRRRINAYVDAQEAAERPTERSTERSTDEEQDGS